MHAYRHTISQHRLLLAAPVVLATLVAAWFVFGTAPSYRSTASLWINDGPAIGSSLAPQTLDTVVNGTSGTTGATVATPSTIEQSALAELLYTASFDGAVGNASLLRSYLATAPLHPGWSPSAFLARGYSPLPTRVEDTVGTQVSSSTPGPQVLKVTFTGPTPAVAQSVTRSLVAELERDSALQNSPLTRIGTSLAEQRLQAAGSALASARSAVAAYQRAHDAATPSNDPIDSALTADVTTDSARLTAAANDLKAALGSKSSGGTGPTVHLLDPATLPSGPVHGPLEQAIGVLCGALAGCLVSILALALLGAEAAPWDRELGAGAGRWVPDRRVLAASGWRHRAAAPEEGTP